MKGIILAGGYATRLLPLTANQPKHLLPINGRAMLDYLLADLMELPIDTYYLVTNNKFSRHFTDWIASSPYKHKVIVVNDGTNTNEDRLGSIGDMAFVIDKFGIKDDLFIIGADNLTDFDFTKMHATFKATHKPLVGVFESHSLAVACQCGVVSIDSANTIMSFVEKPAKPASTLISTLFYMLPGSSVSSIKQLVVEKNTDKAGLLIASILAKQDVLAHVHTGYWFDIGTHDSYAEAQEFMKK